MHSVRGEDLRAEGNLRTTISPGILNKVGDERLQYEGNIP